jgi:hypothetical protein
LGCGFAALLHLSVRLRIIRLPILRWPSICYAVFSEWCKCRGE